MRYTRLDKHCPHPETQLLIMKLFAVKRSQQRSSQSKIYSLCSHLRSCSLNVGAGRPLICYQETGPRHPCYPSVSGTTCGGHLATHSPPSNDTAQGFRDRKAITQAVTGPAACPCIRLMLSITITHKRTPFIPTSQ